MSVRICHYPKPDGSPCGSPTLREKKFCYYHLRDHKRHEHAAKVLRQLDVLGPRLPQLRTLDDVQDALNQILSALADGTIDADRAGTHLFAVQQRSTCLRNPRESRRS